MPRAAQAPVTVLIRLSTATVEMTIVGRDATDVCSRVGRSMRMCGVAGMASVRDGVVVITEAT